MSDADRYLGLDIGGTKCACVVGTGDGRVIERAQWPSDAPRGPEAMIADLLRAAAPLVVKYRPRGVGVSIGGPLDCANGVVLSPPNLPGWDAVPLKARLEEALQLPVAVEHDAAACALAEYRWGAGRDLGPDGTLIYFTAGTGFGVGLVLQGRVYHGAGGRSPEIGHARIADDGPTAFGKPGSVEAFCAGSSLPRIAAWKFPRRWGEAPPDGRELRALAERGDAEALAVLELSAVSTGRVCALVADLFFPHVIVLGSLARYLGEPWLGTVRKTVEAEALPAARCPIEPAALGESLQDLSAVVVALEASRDASRR